MCVGRIFSTGANSGEISFYQLEPKEKVKKSNFKVRKEISEERIFGRQSEK